MQVSAGERYDSSLDQLFDLTGIGGARPNGRCAHVHNEAVAASKPKQLRPSLAEVGNCRINAARAFDAGGDCLPKFVV